MTRNPFAVLGLPAQPDLSDEDVRAAWRRIASATHPDREDGGDPARYAEASNAYAILRTPWGRSEAYADLRRRHHYRTWPRPPPLPAGARLGPWRAVVLVPARVRHGRPARLVLRIVAAAVAALLIWHSGAGTPGGRRAAHRHRHLAAAHCAQ